MYILLYRIIYTEKCVFYLACMPVQLVAQLCPTLCDPMNHNLPGSATHGISLVKNTGVGCHSLLLGIFLTQGLNPGLLHCRWILYHLSPQGRPGFCFHI